MIYDNIQKAKFISRRNRFIAEIEIDGKTEDCHVKNTGRCGELFINGTEIFVQKQDKAERKTKYDLITVNKDGMLINVDSTAPNAVFHEWAVKNEFFGEIKYIKPECKYENSRFDFYIEADKNIFAEIKGVTLLDGTTAMFPDAPTIRGVRHIKELIHAKQNGFDSYIFFVVQAKEAEMFIPNIKTHPEFAAALKEAETKGVVIKCVNCEVLENELKILDFIKLNI